VESTRTFSESTGAADILITFQAIDGSSGTLASTASPSGGGDMTVDSGESWSVQSIITPADKLDFQTIVVHELGHALGLAHSSFTNATMYPFKSYGVQDRSLEQDDAIAISSIYDVWQSLSIPGSAKDIAVSGAGEVWAIGNPAASNGAGFSIYKRKDDDSGWNTVGGIATRIAVTGGGIPWVVDANGVIWRRSSGNPASGSWTALPGCATDIGAGVEGAIWVIGCDTGVYKWNSSTSNWDYANGVGARIAVARNGVPWVVQSGGEVYRRTTSSATTGSWTLLPGSASDIGAMDAVWALGRDSVSGGSSIYVWNEQSQVLYSDGSVAAPALQKWLKVSGGANNISAGRFGPWVTNTSGSVLRQSPWGRAGF
jgi:hypothetical protein